MNIYQETAGNTARLAGEHLIHELTKNGGRKAIHEKDFGETVTNFDREVNSFIIKELQKAFPEHDIITEEAAEIDGANPTSRWFVDPIDGTNNFIRNIPLYCVSIGYEESGIMSAGAIYDPINRVLFHGSLEGGAQMENVDLKVSSTQKLSDAFICSGYGYDPRHRTMHAPIWESVTRQAKGSRSLGTAALMLAYVARGDMDGLILTGDKAWDNAAGALLVRAAGGRVTDYDGKDWQPGDENIVASNGLIHDALLQLINKKRVGV